MLTEEQENQLAKELKYHTSRSGGKGGQNVNKVESKVEIEFNVNTSLVLSESQKQVISRKHKDGPVIRIVSSTHRTQLENKADARGKLFALINRLLKPVKKRLLTKPGRAAKEKKLTDKKIRGEKKQQRKKVKDY